jgi:hypothetical protein
MTIVRVSGHHSQANRYMFLLAGVLLSGTSLTLAGIAGYNRGATPLEAVIWCAAGVALSLCSLAGVSATLTVQGFARKFPGCKRLWARALVHSHKWPRWHKLRT